MRVKFTGQARTHIRAITLFIANDDPTRARSFANELRDACRSLKQNSDRFVMLKNLNGGPLRRMTYRSYAVFYQVQKDQALILRVVHGAAISSKFVEDLA